MAARDRIIALLRTHPDGLDDDAIAEKLGLSRRQQANSRCRELEREGIVERRSMGGKIRNILTANAPPVQVRAETVTGPADVDPGRPWCWEGTVVRSVISFLTARGWSIEAIANTETGSEEGAAQTDHPPNSSPPLVRRGLADRAASASGEQAAPCGHRFP
jgi:hypothetical protein